MKKYKLENFIKGWVIGDFNPSVFQTKNFEVAVKKYKKGDCDEVHFHKEADEFAIIISGVFKLNNNILKEGDVVWIERKETVDFLCLEDGHTTVIKIPSVKNDKYPITDKLSDETSTDKVLNIVIPMAGKGSRFQEAGYTFPKPLIEINDKTMIETVINNLTPTCKHKFIFICRKEHCDKYDIYNILKKATNNNFEIIKVDGITQGAVCTILCAIQHINNENDLLVANSDQFVEININDFIKKARQGEKDGLIMTFYANHPKWSYARVDENNKVLEVAEKKVISNEATVGIYYFKKGSDFIKSAQSMIEKNIRYNNEFYVCPVYNEMILDDKNIYIYPISNKQMHGLGTPEDVKLFLQGSA